MSMMKSSRLGSMLKLHLACVMPPPLGFLLAITVGMVWHQPGEAVAHWQVCLLYSCAAAAGKQMPPANQSGPPCGTVQTSEACFPAG